MAFDPTSANEKGKRFSVAFNTSKEARAIVLKATQPVILSGGIVSDHGSDGTVNVTACKYIDGTHIKTAPAVTAMVITSGHHQYVDTADATIKSAASTPSGGINLATSTHSGGAVSVSMSRLRLRVAADTGADDLD
jgi:hypothetical protein